MVKINKIYTRTGDSGSTGIVTGERLAKTHPRIIAIGEVDELNAAIGLCLDAVSNDLVKGTLLGIQNDLFDVGADIATPGEVPGALRLAEDRPAKLEEAIDALNEDLPPLKSFILPSGPGGASALHLARAIARRAERCIWALTELPDGENQLNPTVPTYLNRLSDYLFVAARMISREAGGEVLWVPGGAR